MPSILLLSQLPQPPNASVATYQSVSQLHEPTPSWPRKMICKVCGGRAIGERYGVLSCAPCGKYFNRNKKKSIGQCKRNGNCNHTLWRCNPCRFKKCLEAGMSVQRLTYQYPPPSPPDNAGNSISHSSSSSLSKAAEQIKASGFKTCPVCGKYPTGFRDGVPTCFACGQFFSEAQRKQPIGDCKKEGKCQINQCALCRYQKCLKAGMRQEKKPAFPRISPTTAIVHEIIAAHHLICEYTEGKMKKMVVKEYPWTPDKNTDQKINRMHAWKAYSMQVVRDIKSTISFIRHLENNLPSADKVELIKEHAFKMHLVRITRALSRNGLLLPDGRLIDLEFFKALYGEQLAEEMITFANQALNIFKLDDDGLALLLTMSFYSEITDNNLVFFRSETPQALKNLSQEYRRNFIRWCDTNKAPRTFRNVQLMLDRLKQLDELHKTNVIDFLRGNAEHFNRKTVFAEVYLNRHTEA
ncbi:hypothetical protein CAEBREN_02900 [Caenorhabditis brenneri]|uniref:Nuclear receptor domain-containing protein n=1 Tax=Caenorhabditis brenneri TaxID=135651 RepID=G0P3T7_CAEBE|nr:hypothetical protein CAEBREN_02900 [Caenorhabditis brenneri]